TISIGGPRTTRRTAHERADHPVGPAGRGRVDVGAADGALDRLVPADCVSGAGVLSSIIARLGTCAGPPRRSVSHAKTVDRPPEEVAVAIDEQRGFRRGMLTHAECAGVAAYGKQRIPARGTGLKPPTRRP